MNRMTFAEKLRELRVRASISQERLAEQLGVSRQVVTRWENGTGTPKIENLKAIADCFHVTLDELLGRTEASDKDLSARYRMTIEELSMHGYEAVRLIDQAITIRSRMAREVRDTDEKGGDKKN